MSRFLFVVPPLAGHVQPTVAVGAELSARGHEVAWAGRSQTLTALLPPAATVWAVDQELSGQPLADRLVRWRGLRAATAFRFFWEEFLIPLAHSMIDGVDAAVDAFDPHVLVADQQALAGALVARARGLPWATSATTTAELTGQYETMPKLGVWARERLDEFQREHGVGDPVDLRFSDRLILTFSTADLLRPPDGVPEQVAFVGPAIGARPAGPDFPWDWLDPQRAHVLVSLGTVNRDSGHRFFAAALDALAPLADRLQAVLVADPDTLPDPPPNVLVRPSVPQLELLARMDAVVCHGGHNTTCEALAHRLPLVVAPIRDDQPAVASQVTAAGAGLRVKFGRVGPGELREAVLAVLDDPAYRTAAAAIAASFDAAGGARVAADHLEKLA